MADFLLELFSEEIPARMQIPAAMELEITFRKALDQANLTYKFPETGYLVTPRRLAILIKDLPPQQPDTTIEKKGPKTTAPQAAIDGFLKSSSLTMDKLEKRMVGKDETYFAVIHQKGQPTAQLLKSVVEKILADFPWPKSMRWGTGETRWVRPLHSILCLFDGKVVPVEFAGIKAGNVTYGHRFLAPDAITIAKENEYEAALYSAKVIANELDRRTKIQTQAQEEAEKYDLVLMQDKDLLKEVTGLVEWPTALMGRIDAKFMDLPPEVLTSEMRAHQKYFALTPASAQKPSPSGRGVGEGQLAPRFIIISNMVTSDGGKSVVAGNERVLRARLSDGRFFFDQDRKKPLSEWAKGLADVTFHAKISTIAQKVERIEKLAAALTQYVPAADATLTQRAAQLCKADLVTGMVGEFPELQGVMGRYYALAQNEDAAVADAIRDHYLPLGPDSPVPTKPVSICIALADKLDTLISMFAAGEKPTGSKDPFALRRSALGIIRIILENNIRFHLSSVIAPHIRQYFNPQNDEEHIKVLGLEMIGFFSDRLKVQLKDSGIRHDMIAAVFAAGEDDLVRLSIIAKTLQAFLATEDGTNLLTAYRRAANIVGIEEKKDKQAYNGDVNPILLKEQEEENLYKRLMDSKLLITQSLRQEKFDYAMTALASLRQRIDSFFDKVLVNADDKNLRGNRLKLLSLIRVTIDSIANFALIEG